MARTYGTLTHPMTGRRYAVAIIASPRIGYWHARVTALDAGGCVVPDREYVTRDCPSRADAHALASEAAEADARLDLH